MFTKQLLGFIRLILMSMALFFFSTPLLAAETPIATAPWNGKIYDVKTRRLVTKEELIQKLLLHRIVVLGEKHYSATTQQVEGEIIQALAESPFRTQQSLTTAWEFLLYKNQSFTEALYSRFLQQEITAPEFLQLAHGGEKVELYSPMVLATRNAEGRLLGVNLSREEKAPVVEKGLSGVNPELLPPGFALGGEAYFKRFELSMAGHGKPEKLRNYFEAQCLTDDVMAFHLTEHDQGDIRVLVTGSFHTDFNDGVVARLQARAGKDAVVNIRLLDLDDYVESELIEYIHDPVYGDIADYVYFIREPFVP